MKSLRKQALRNRYSAEEEGVEEDRQERCSTSSACLILEARKRASIYYPGRDPRLQASPVGPTSRLTRWLWLRPRNWSLATSQPSGPACGRFQASKDAHGAHPVLV